MMVSNVEIITRADNGSIKNSGMVLITPVFYASVTPIPVLFIQINYSSVEALCVYVHNLYVYTHRLQVDREDNGTDSHCCLA